MRPLRGRGRTRPPPPDRAPAGSPPRAGGRRSGTTVKPFGMDFVATLDSVEVVEEVAQAAENIVKGFLWFNDYNVIARECTTTLATLYTTSGSSIASMFQGCSSLQKLPPLDCTNVTNASTAFSACFNLKTITLLNSQKVESWTNTFAQCHNLQSISATFSSANTSFGNTFSNCLSLKTHPPLNVTNVTSLAGTPTISAKCVTRLSILI